MNATISVIVPVYRVEDYLPRCLDSILEQDYRDLEVILIDDGSPDGCGSICDAYAARDSRIRVIHQENGGAAAAKNSGLKIATGKYLAFADSDDYLEPGAYSHMLRLMEQYDADVVQCAFRDVYRNRCEDVIFAPERIRMKAEDYLIRYTGPDWSCPLLWDKLYKRELFDGILFETGHKIDDEYFTYQGIMNAKTVLRDSRIVYNYRRRASGVMLSPQSREKIAFDRVDFLSKRRALVADRFPSLRAEFNHHFLCTILELAQNRDNSPESFARIKKALAEYLADENKTPVSPRLWPGLLRLRLLNVSALKKRAVREENCQTDPDNLFA